MSTLLYGVCLFLCVTSLQVKLTTMMAVHNSEEDKNNTKIMNQSAQFVNWIKQDLRHNNDDYSLHNESIELDGRRSLNDSFRIEIPNNDLAQTALPENNVFRSGLDKEIVKKKKHDRHFQHNKPKHNIHKDIETTHETTKTEGKRHVDKWKELIEKNKRLRAYTSSPKIEPSTPPPAWTTTTEATTRFIQEYTTRRTFRPIARTVTHTTTTPTTTTTKEIPRMITTTRTKRRTSQRTTTEKFTEPIIRTGYGRSKTLPFLQRTTTPYVLKSPDADQLDMAPAKGALVHDMRLKGRLCHRHVLWPEGPKYDSKGNIILREFNSSRYGKRTFIQTEKPLYLLPRCCNCCKKSVLGCQ